MGRGRAKAKQTKVARELKYSSPATDYAALQRELSSDNGDSHHVGERDRADDAGIDDAGIDEYGEYSR
ncbi:MAG: DUF3073 domain-containing protein [Pseudonocardiales bacterium]|nr:DUF3073 domain-containing protein [Actinomycetota bacterium]PZS16136.1 MAG: DUF3073 domain-containing protein [Pseudonocardiales bacterium]